MIFHEFGEGEELVLLLHPMLLNGTYIYNIMKGLGKYKFISPDLSDHGDDRSVYKNSKWEARELDIELKNRGYFNFKLIYGASIGSKVALELVRIGTINYDKMVLDGVSLSEDAWFMRNFSKLVLLRQYKLAKRYPGKSLMLMEKIYPTKGKEMLESFVKMRETSIININKDFTYYKYFPLDLTNILFLYGGRDKFRNTINSSKYKNANIRIFKGYRHCEYMLRQEDKYISFIRNFID